MNSFAKLLLIFVVFQFAGAIASAQEVRTFTDLKGRPLKATLIDAGDSTVTVERSPDGAKFDIPIASLSQADQEWIAAWIKRNRPEKEPLGDGWFRVAIDLPNPMNSVEVVGFEREYATRTGSSTFEMLLPQGAWIKPQLQGQNGLLFTMIEYRGERNLTIRTEQNLVLVSRDGKPPKIAGVLLPHEEDKLAGILANLSRNRFDETFCIGIYRNSTHLDEILKSKIPVGAIAIYEPLEAGDLVKIASMMPRAVSIRTYHTGFAEVAALGNVECVDLSVPYQTDFAQGFPKEDIPLDFPILPAITQLAVWGDMADLNFDQFLAAKPRLRLFQIQSGLRGEPTPLNGIGSIETLTMLNPSTGVRIDPAELSGLPHLRYLAITPQTVSKTAANAAELTKLDDLLVLDLDGANLPHEVIQSWVESGNLAGLRNLSLRHPVDLARLPSLETLDLKSTSFFGPHKLEGLKENRQLDSLFLESPGERDLAAIATFPFFARLRSLRFSKSSLETLEPLAAARNLRVLDVFSDSRIQSFDLGVIPTLEHLRLIKCSSLTSIDGISAHRKLEGLNANDCQQLTGLGQPGPNNTLRALTIYRCNGLTTLEPLYGLTGLKQLTIQECAGLKEPLKLDELNDLEYKSIDLEARRFP